LIPNTLTQDHFYEIMATVRKRADELDLPILSNWLNHKDKNPWILQGLSIAITGINNKKQFFTIGVNREDWKETSFTTNIAESAHAQSQREGKHLTLLTALKKSIVFDRRFFHAQAATRVGISARYGNNSITGRERQKIKRSSNTQAKKNKSKGAKGKGKEPENEPLEAQVQRMEDAGVNPEEIAKFKKRYEIFN
jgi:hypothetical protein